MSILTKYFATMNSIAELAVEYTYEVIAVGVLTCLFLIREVVLLERLHRKCKRETDIMDKSILNFEKK